MNRLLLTYSINNSKSLLTKTSQRFLTTGEHDLKIDYLKKSLEPFSRPPNDYEKLLVKHPSIGKLKRSSILVPITIKHEKNEQGVRVQKSYYTLTQRANTVKYKGEVCFVGGNRDITDTNDIHTAFREANEEIGMDADRLTFLAQLCPIVNTKGDLITPILAYFDDTDYTAKCNQHEVTHAFKLPTERFILNSGHTFKSFKSGKIEYYLHFFKDLLKNTNQSIEIETWGLTAFTAILVSSMLHSRLPDFELDPQIKLDNETIFHFLDFYLEKTLSMASSYKEFNKFLKQ